MAYTVGTVDFVEVRWSGDTLTVDHPEAVTTLQVADISDFTESGGSLMVGEDVYTYSVLDPELETITLDTPTVVAYEMGEPVKVQPEATSKVAYCYIDDSDDSVPVRVPHSMKDRLSEGDRLTDEQETLTLYMDGGQWVIQDVVDQPVLIDPSYLDPDGPELPPQLIPGEGWDYMGPIAPENIRTGTLQSRVQIGEEIWVARYSDPTDPDSPVDPDSGVVSITPDDGLRLRIPNQDDPTAEPTTIAHLPTALYDEAGNRVTAVFQGRADFSVATGQQFRMIGHASDGDRSTIGTGSELQLNNAVADPSNSPGVTFGPLTRAWSNTPSDYRENGWGVSGDTVVFAVRDTTTNGRTRFRFLNPTTGYLDHDVYCQLSPRRLASMTVCDGHIYTMMGDARSFAIIRFDLNGQLAGGAINIDRWSNGAGQIALGVLDGRPTMVYRDINNRIRFRQYRNGINGLESEPDTWATDHYDSNNRVLSGVADAPNGRAYVFSGSRIVQLDNRETSNDPASFWSGIGAVNGGGFLPDGTLATFNGQGSCATYNEDPSVDTEHSVHFATTVANTTTGRESGMSPPVTRTWTAKAYATIQADWLEPGTDRARFYGSTTGTTYTDMIRIGESGRAVIIGPISALPSTGAHPPETSQFTSSGETPGKIVSQATIPGSTRRAVSIDAQGHAELYGLVEPFISRYRTSNLIIPHASQTDVPMDGLTESDTTGCITHSLVAGGVYTVAWPGRYRIETQISWMDATGYRTLIVQVNGNPVANGFSSANTYTTCIVVKTVRLNIGDTITVRGYQNSGSGLAVRGSDNANLTFTTIGRVGA